MSAFHATVQLSEDRIARLLFKQTVELSMMMNVLAAGLEIDDSQPDGLGWRCVQNVKKANGSIIFKDTLAFGVTYDATTNSVHIDSTQPYQEESAPTVSAFSEEAVRTAILGLKKVYPHGAEYPAPYRPNNPLDRPFSNCDHCAGWAMLCSDAAFGDLPWRRVNNPRWEDIRVGDVIDYRNEQSGHAIVVIGKNGRVCEGDRERYQ